MSKNVLIKTLLLGLIATDLNVGAAADKKFPPVGLVGHWDFNEGRSDIVHDRAGWIGEMKATGGPKWVKNASGYCLLFDNQAGGNPVYLEMPTHFPFGQEMADGSRLYNRTTISFWLNPVAEGYVPAERNFGCLFYATFILQEKHLQFNVSDTEMNMVFRLDAPKPESGKWTHVAGGWDGDVARLYVNGQLVRQKGGEALINTIAPPQGKSPFRFGLVYPWDQTGRLKAYIDELKYYSRVLTAEEVKKEYEDGLDKVKIAK